MKPKKFDSINVIPFIDIMLVLLVIILTTASFVAKGIIPVNLPSAKSATIKKDKKSLVVTIKANDEILFNESSIDEKELENSLLKYDKKTNIEINCDKDVRFELFIKLLDTLKENEFENIAIITKKESKS
ncbi:TonB system transport protein ExbD [Halarcobacter ebronensis]|uniref:Biopolymer transport protein ExbD n=1 Tax=Halarcobacter ebronensis TaxID=1462615 RepID=A0A4Q1AQT8_9BACT|nr:TonB system transport protein ExbD [Halarcobacter ebronensis]QKF83248.1 TonB system transport protein ExbD [Halarcobacter ebronensis]RXK05117.1 TonB system transport protein ExbD [Halarcobacter ebronensis]